MFNVKSKETTAAAVADRVKKTRAETATLMSQRRNQVCVAPKYPGKPDQYRYVLAEYCVKKDGSKVLKKARKQPDLVGIAAEIKTLKSYLRKHQEPQQAVSGRALLAVSAMFPLLTNDNNRQKLKDPIERYNVMLKLCREKLHLSDDDVVPRIIVLSLLRSHLENLLKS